MEQQYIKRAISASLLKLSQNFPCVIIMGAHGVGKTTLIKHLFPHIPYFVFDPIHDLYNVRQDPELFLNNNPPPIILDEIQYAPELVPIIKRKVDRTKGCGQYILTVSQQWNSLKNIKESLAGRAALLQLERFAGSELAKIQPKTTWLEEWLLHPEDFLQKKYTRLDLTYTLYEQLWRGFLPQTQFLDLNSIQDFHRSYQSTYIEKDILLLGDIQDLPLFSRFVRLVAAYTAQEINHSQLGREIGITPQTAKRWLQLLLQTFEWFEIPAYSNNAIKKISSRSKGYFSDTGQVAFSQMISSKDALAAHPLFGALFETLVANDIRKQGLFLATPPQMYHWRIHSGSECDIILERDGKLYPIEIKATTKVGKKDAQGLTAFRKLHEHLNVQKGLIIAPIEEPYAVTENDITIPWDLAGSL